MLLSYIFCSVQILIMRIIPIILMFVKPTIINNDICQLLIDY